MKHVAWKRKTKHKKDLYNSIYGETTPMVEYTQINVLTDTKEEFDKQRTLEEGTVSQDEFLAYLLKQNKKRGK